MEARVKILGHPVHQMLIVLPLGLLTGAVVFDIVALVSRNGYWAEIAYWLIVAGVISGLIAAPFGTLDWTRIPPHTRAKRIGVLHGAGNGLVLLLFGASWWLRREQPPEPVVLALLLSFAGAAVSLFTGWLGGELVDRLAVGVHEGAHVDAPSSLSGRPAGESDTVTPAPRRI